jgi:2-polyprenyl-3-methyl-5-hydroxy-6-metoxy-1,4-benzoquinol methylase
MTRAHGRQTATTLDGIRADHRYRYEWAAKNLMGLRVLDAGCGIGYGSYILGQAGCRVASVDGSEEAIQAARKHYAHDNVTHFQGEIQDLLVPYDAIVCFEVLEHIDNAPEIMRLFSSLSDRLLCSVPNEEVVPFEQTRPLGHVRHYTPGQFRTLLAEWDEPGAQTIRTEYHQEGKHDPVERGFGGRTLIADLRR